jgi:UDP-glucose 4-epimerase
METEVGEWPGSSSNLIPLVLDAAIGRREDIKIFGTDYPTSDGTCIRDYIHVTDLATAHVLAFKYLVDGGESRCLNLGNGKGFSVKEVVAMAKKVTGIDFKVTEVERRAGDPPELVADSKLAQQILKWQPQYQDLEVIVESAWKWHQKVCKLIS